MAKKSRMAQGTIEYGDVYTERRTEDGKPVIIDGHFVRDQMIGRLIVDFGKNEFWMRPIVSSTAQRLSMQDVSSLVANDLIRFDQPRSRQQLIQYLMEYDKRTRTLEEAEVKAIERKSAAKELKEEGKLQRAVTRNTMVARMTWTLAMIGFVAIALVASMPGATPAPPSATISGVGQDYGVESSQIQDAAYIQALGNGTSLYGVVTDTKTKEVGDTENGNATVTENVVFTPSSSSRGMHLRPLYYDKASFHQGEMTVDTYGGSRTALYLQNPNGYALGVSANQVMLVYGQGFTTIPMLTPEAFADKTAADTQGDIEDAQANSAKERASANRATRTNDDATGAGMPKGWLGVDHASINNERVAVSYWYTKDNTGKAEDKHRRVAVLNIKDVLANGRDAVDDIDIAQLNYQDKDSNFYAPETAMDSDSKGTTYLLAYTKQDYNGNIGFFVRRIQSNEDVLVESYTNTFSTQDLTGSSSPITNYKFFGNRLFFEQDGYIWMMNLSEGKLSVTIDGDKRTVSRENPTKICKVSDIYASITSDEQRAADETSTPVTPIAHYTPMTISTADGKEYGIVFIESDTNDLVFQPAVDMTTASSGSGSGTGADSTANGVSSGDEAAIQKLLEEDNNDDKDHDLDGTDIEIPNLVGMKATDAIKTLQGLKFTVRTTGGTGTVTSYTPSETGKYGSTVTLTLGGTSQNDDNTNASQSGASTLGRIRQAEYTLNAPDRHESEARQDSNGDDGRLTNDSASTNDGVADDAKNDGQGRQSHNGGNETESNIASALRDDTDNGRIVIRDVGRDHATVICYAVRGEQIVWMEKAAGSNDRSVRFSPIYYKDSRSTVEAYEADNATENAITNETTDTDGQAQPQQDNQPEERRQNAEQEQAEQQPADSDDQ